MALIPERARDFLDAFYDMQFLQVCLHVELHLMPFILYNGPHYQKSQGLSKCIL